MASEIDICNTALTKLGATTIISLADDDPKATVMNLRYPLVRDAELRRRRWKFSLRRASLPAMSDAPAFGFARQFRLPTDPLCLRVIQVGEFHVGLDLSDYRGSPNEMYSIEGTRLLTNFAAPLKLRYIAQVTDSTQFDAAFVEALASRLAYECCERITQSSSKKSDCLVDYKMAVKEATLSNALESAPSHPADDTWMMSRLGC